MTPDDVRILIAGGETLSVEFKRASAGALSDSDIVREVVCLANAAGGTLLLGVEDDGRVTGLAPRHGDTTEPSRLEGMILNKTEPNVVTAVQVIQVDGCPVAAIEVGATRIGPVGTTDGYYVRRSRRADGTPECVPYRPSEMQAAALNLTGGDYATVEARGAQLSDLDVAEFERFRKLCRTGSGERGLAGLADLEILRALRLDTGQGATPQPALGAILLFGTDSARERWTPTAECLFQDFRSAGATVNESLRLPLLKAAEALDERLALRNTFTELLVGLHRVDVPLIAPTTVREVVANALVHRSYAQLGPTEVQLTDEALVVTSPGGLPDGVTLENLLDRSSPRSVALADAFKRAGVVDRRGKGINEMFSSQLRAGRYGPDYSKTTSSSVTATIPTGRADLDLVRFVLAFENSQQTVLTLEDLRVVHHLHAVGPSTAPELAADLSLVHGVARGIANRLVERGLIEARGNGRHRRFHLTATFYSLAEDRDAYVRVRGIDELQQEQMVTEYVRRYGSITRAQAAALVQISPEAASRLLRSMASRDLLRMRGERRTAHYVLEEAGSE